MTTEFKEWPKIDRLLDTEVLITEKIDGTNALIYIGPPDPETGAQEFLTGKRTSWCTPDKDNYGFSTWAHANKQELMKLGIGWHYGEWWGSGIQRRYGFSNGERFFSLFDVSRREQIVATGLVEIGVRVVPTIGEVVLLPSHAGNLTHLVNEAMIRLSFDGSFAAPGFMDPEGIVIRFLKGHRGGGAVYKHLFNPKPNTNQSSR